MGTSSGSHFLTVLRSNWNTVDADLSTSSACRRSNYGAICSDNSKTEQKASQAIDYRINGAECAGTQKR